MVLKMGKYSEKRGTQKDKMKRRYIILLCLEIFYVEIEFSEETELRKVVGCRLKDFNKL